MSEDIEFNEIWRKEISSYLLIEYEKRPRMSPCHIIYLPDDDIQFNFGSWGIEHEDITEEIIWYACQYFLYIDCNVTFSSLYDCYEFAYQEMTNDDDDEEDLEC